MKFKVGDYVRGISGSGLLITNEKMTKAVVIKIRPNSFDIRVLKHRINNGWFINKVFTIDNEYADYFIKINDDTSRVNVEETKLVKLIRVDGVTIAIPVNTPIGISITHPDDKYIKEIGDSLAIGRLSMEYEK